MIRRLLILGCITLTLAGLSACSVLREPSPTPAPAGQVNPSFPVFHLTADQAAEAMEADEFFAKYGYSTLLIQGTVFSVNRQNGDLVVGLDTSVPTKVLCDLGAYVGIIKVGAEVTVQIVYPERDAKRQASAVLFENCTIAQ